MLGLFKSRKAAPAVDAALPLSVESALCGLSVMNRPDMEDSPRVLLQWAGSGATVAWHHTPDETRKRMVLAFPHLTDGQLDLVMRAVAGMVRNAQHADNAPTKRRSAWSSWQPNRKQIFE